METNLLNRIINDDYIRDMELFFLLLLFKDDDLTPDLTINVLLENISYNQKHTRAGAYAEEWIPRYLATDFFQLFRMTKRTFYKLLTKLNCKAPEYSGGGLPIEPEKQLLMTIWWLGKGETLLSVGDKFNVTVSTVYKCTEYILSKMLGITKSYVVWPDVRERIQIERDFHARAGYPGVIGAMDGCNIKFKCPKDQQESYIDKNMSHSIKLQGIVTSQKIFTSIFVGFPGSVHDSRVLQNSNIFTDIEHRHDYNKYFHEDYHLVADKAYPLRKWIMTPFKNTGNITPSQIGHNLVHSRTRVVVEHTFGILKSRWRMLHYVNVNSVEKTTKIIAACCTLHNFCYINADYWDNYVEAENRGEDMMNERRADLLEGEVKRNRIVHLLGNQM